MSIDSASLAAVAVAQHGATYSQQVATAVTRQQLDAERSVAAFVAETANIPAPPPPGQGQILDVSV
ncbi:hypothetical protein NS228_17395 [Methylobacterium indicum]|uniref:Motility protein n=1 Tax=Methylobacterium indicum TaxID=1775910 RepID=A0A0J6U0R2_9HYPH|nr:putative motility protein [Methylobacterium indicum]KMO11658.1 hypothetical protein QR79_29705 [Methylobacterium indicum]KMO18706.1 hypothetical protein QR78_14925 [Methylobacterium indicum]KTS37796.1 hypothetical protein NS229_06185 [Methylobacterium indicum]KTS38319.1 hypothetical protein NS228_17395 [Methylobacterium indicum]KTS53657.1 hypothetical protein NS230_04630 [Methylobacterium indicum]